MARNTQLQNPDGKPAPEAYPPCGKDDAIERTGRVQEVVGESRDGGKGEAGPAVDPAEGKR